MAEKYSEPPSEPELGMQRLLGRLGIEYCFQFPTRHGFVLDFAFLDQKKAIEVDGFYHQFRKGRDAFRDSILERDGWSILRIKAGDIEGPKTLLKIRSFLEKDR